MFIIFSIILIIYYKKTVPFLMTFLNVLSILGSPNEDTWPGMTKLPDYKVRNMVK